MEIKGDKPYGLLHLYETLMARNVVNREEMALRLGVSTKTITRYIQDINSFLAEEKTMHVAYSRQQKGYVLADTQAAHLSREDVLAISKVLLESRGFNQVEVNSLLQKLMQQCTAEDRGMIKKTLQSEMNGYVEPKHGQSLITRIWEISQAIKEQHIMEIEYTKIGPRGKIESEPVKRNVEPQGLLFSEYYFYLVAMIAGKDYEFPAIYRLDRIQEYTILPKHFRVAYRDRFSEGEFRKLVQFMQGGNLQTITFRFRGESVEAVLDRLPHAEVLEEKEGVYVIQAKTFGRGIVMWLLSQGEGVEVLKPPSLRDEMKQRLEKMQQVYL
ncbi:WYL domain-containing transcriptional regulator [Anoxynatronum sibiricum]|uniref:WYL domain-containing transcriptional regulator n=1 Tax=Anoxynatronum sibiricum TaxID=210623 RepID=A0ABU9VV25_9CLOT